MSFPYATVGELRRSISTEILVATGLPRTGLLQTLFRPFVWPPAHRFARLAAEFDRRLALFGLTEAMRWALSRLVGDACAYGTEHVPSAGPLIVASNHPGSYDVLVIASSLGRDDLKILVSDVPFLRNLVATARHFIYTDTGPNSYARMAAARESIRHLEAGGALLVYASGQVDPDPALLPGAEEALGEWSSSLPLLLRHVPESRLLVTIVSGVLAPSCLSHPLTRLRREQRLKQFLAEFIQVGQQVLFDRRFALTPEVRFAAPLTAADLDAGRDGRAALGAIVAQARALLAEVRPGRSTALEAALSRF
jgi:hypothetical protein